MPVSDEYVQALQNASPEEREKHFNTLTPERQQEVFEAVKSWKAKQPSDEAPPSNVTLNFGAPENVQRTSSGEESYPAPSPVVEHLSNSFAVAPHLVRDNASDTAKALLDSGRNQTLGALSQDSAWTAQVQKDMGLTPEKLQGILSGSIGSDKTTQQKLVEHAMSYALKKPLGWLQENVGKPFSNALLGMAGFDTTAPLPGGQSLASTPENLLTRSALQTYAGPSILDAAPGFSERDKLEAQHGLVEAFGPTGAQVALAASDLAGSWPVFSLMPQGPVAKITKAVDAATAGLPIAGKLVAIATASARGAEAGLVQSIFAPHTDVKTSVEQGAILGGAAKAIGITGKKLLGLMTSDTSQQLARELNAAREAPGVEILHPDKLPEDFSPTHVSVGVEAGKVVAKLAQIGQDGVKLTKAVSIDSIEELNKLIEKIRNVDNSNVKIPFELLRDPALANKSGEWFARLWRGAKEGIDSAQLDNIYKYRLYAGSKSMNLDAPSPAPSSGAEVLLDSGGKVESHPLVESDSGRRAGDLPLPGEQAIGIKPDGEKVVGQVLPPRGVGDKTDLLPAGSEKPVEALNIARASEEEAAQAHGEAALAGLKTNPGTPKAIKAVSGGTTGEAIANPPEPPTLPPRSPTQRPYNPGLGELVYIQNSDGTYTTGEVAGGKGQSIAVKVNGSTKYVDPAKLWPANRGIADPGTMQPAQPPVGALPSIGQLPPHLAQQYADIDSMASRFAGQGFLDKLRRGLFGGGLTGPQDLALRVQAIKAAKALENTSMQVFRGIRNALPKDVKLLSAFDKDFNALAKGNQVDMSKYGEAWSSFKNLAQQIFAQRDALDAKIAALGGIPQEYITDRMAGIKDAYVARSYLSYVLPPGKWAKLAPPNVREDAIDFITKQAATNGYAISPHEVGLNLHNIMKDKDSLNAFVISPMMQKAFKRLKSISDIPDVVRKAMGEVESGTYNMATTLGSQRAVAANLQLMAELSTNRQYYSPGPRADLHAIPLPNSPAFYGKASGGYVHPDIYDALLGASKGIEQGPSILGRLQGFMKANLVGANPGAILHHNMANVWHAYLSGGLDPFGRPLESGRALMDAWKALRAHAVDPTGAGPGALVLEAQRFGALRPGFGSQEIQKIREGFAAHLEEGLRESGAIPDAWSFVGALNKAAVSYKKFQGELGHFYDYMNDVSKLASYASLRRRGLASGLPLREAAEQAAHKINLSYPDPSNLGSYVDKLRSTVGVGAPFLTPIAEEARIHALLPQRLMNEPDLRWRMAQAGIAGLALFGANGIARRLNGISDEEVDAANAELTRRQRNYRPALAAAAWRDSEGRIKMYDLTHFSYLSKLFEGNPDDSMFRRVFANLLTSPLSGTAKEGVDATFAKLGLIHPLPSFQPLEGEGGLLNFMKTAQDAGFGAPEIVGRALSAARKGGLLGKSSPSQEVFTPGEMAEQVAGSPFAMPVTVPGSAASVNGAPSALGAAREDSGMLKQLQAEYEQAAKSGDKERALRVLERIKQVAANASSRGTAIQRFQGVSR